MGCDGSYYCPANIDDHEWNCEALAHYRRLVAYEEAGDGDEG